VILVASRTEDPRLALFGVDGEEQTAAFTGEELCGFYWTEGLRGLGWAVDAVPTLKGGSTIGIPSPPAIWDPVDGSITTPDIRDAERLQGFDADWTALAVEVPGVRPGHRWKLVGNAVSVPLAEWVGQRLRHPTGEIPASVPLPRGISWPRAAWGHKRRVYSVDVSTFPASIRSLPLRRFLSYPQTPLSHRAASGFLGRAQVSGLRFEAGFLDDVKRHIAKMAKLKAA
jgi:DNA (cytosine-5)-methyltransferase 1